MSSMSASLYIFISTVANIEYRKYRKKNNMT